MEPFLFKRNDCTYTSCYWWVERDQWNKWLCIMCCFLIDLSASIIRLHIKLMPHHSSSSEDYSKSQEQYSWSLCPCSEENVWMLCKSVQDDDKLNNCDAVFISNSARKVSSCFLRNSVVYWPDSWQKIWMLDSTGLRELIQAELQIKYTKFVHRILMRIRWLFKLIFHFALMPVSV